jgi:uncharacterized protein (TIGR00369 family)
MTLTAAAINAIIRQGLPAAEESGFRVEEVTEEAVICRMHYSPAQLRPGGTLSGPTMMALADAAMYAAVMARLSRAGQGQVEMAVTQNININFMARPAQADLIARAEVLKMGRRTVVMDVRIFSEGSLNMVAHATGTYSLPPGKNRADKE